MIVRCLKYSCLLAVLALTGCATVANYRSATHSWVGGKARKLVRTSPWGYPDYKEKLADGNSLYIYNHHRNMYIPPITIPGETHVDQTQPGVTVVTQTPSTTTPGFVEHYRCKTWFEINRQGNIVGTNFKGNDCALTDDQTPRWARQQLQPPKPRQNV
jgi:hypothetical protein